MRYKPVYPKVVKQVALDVFWADHAGYFLCEDGNIWHINCKYRSNCGPAEIVIERIKSGQLRGKLLEVQP